MLVINSEEDALLRVGNAYEIFQSIKCTQPEFDLTLRGMGSVPVKNAKMLLICRKIKGDLPNERNIAVLCENNGVWILVDPMQGNEGKRGIPLESYPF